jgi:hypothetical protein
MRSLLLMGWSAPAIESSSSHVTIDSSLSLISIDSSSLSFAMPSGPPSSPLPMSPPSPSGPCPVAGQFTQSLLLGLILPWPQFSSGCGNTLLLDAKFFCDWGTAACFCPLLPFIVLHCRPLCHSSGHPTPSPAYNPSLLVFPQLVKKPRANQTHNW